MYMTDSVLVVTGMRSGDCARSVKDTLLHTHGVTDVSVNWPIHEVKVHYDSDVVDAKLLSLKVKGLGYNVGGII